MPKSNYLPETALPRPRKELVFKRVAEGAVVFSVSDETYFGLNEVAAAVWELLPPSTQSFGELCAQLTTRYTDVPPSQIIVDVQDLLADLEEMGLLTSASAG